MLAFVVTDELLKTLIVVMRGPGSSESHPLSYLPNRRFPHCIYGARTFAILRAVPGGELSFLDLT